MVDSLQVTSSSSYSSSSSKTNGVLEIDMDQRPKHKPSRFARPASPSASSSSSQSNGILEIDMDRLPKYKPSRFARAASPALSIGSSPCLSNGTSSKLGANTGRFSKLIGNLEKMLNDNEWNYSDAEIVVEGVPVGVVRFVLASSTPFFHELFKNRRPIEEDRPRFYIFDLVPSGNVGLEAFLLVLSYLYTGNLKSYPQEVAKCVDDGCSHEACPPAIDFQLQLLYASATFQIDELVSLLQTDLLNVVEKASVEDVIPILVAAFHCRLDLLQNHCIKEVAQSDLQNLWINIELPQELQLKVRAFREEYPMECSAEKTIERVYEALETFDVELLKRILKECETTLDEVYGLHYAVAYCQTDFVLAILNLGVADVNLRNSRGHTVLHMAARRRDPLILESLLSKGAYTSDCTFDGQTAVSICRRMTKLKDYNPNMLPGEASSKGQLCIEMLERELLRQSTSVVIPHPIAFAAILNSGLDLDGNRSEILEGDPPKTSTSVGVLRPAPIPFAPNSLQTFEVTPAREKGQSRSHVTMKLHKHITAVLAAIWIRQLAVRRRL